MGSILFHSRVTEDHGCPVCPDHKYSKTNVRFVLACPNGHLDEIDWHYAVHGSDNSCKPKYYLWEDGGRDFSDIKITCPDCPASTDMDKIYTTMSFACSGRLPEKQYIWWNSENNINDSFAASFDKSGLKGCKNKHMSIVQKQSTSLRVPNSIVLLKIPEDNENTDIINILSKNKFRNIRTPISKCTNSKDLLDLLVDMGDDYIIIKEYMLSKRCNNHNAPEYNQNFENFKKLFLDAINGVDFSDALLNEYFSLSGGIIRDENIIKEDFIDYNLNWLNYSFPLKICPISKLKTVTAQLNYVRLPGNEEEIENLQENAINVGHKNGDEVWYPAYEGVGEGIFITSEKNPLEYLGIDQSLIDKWDKVVKTIDSRGRDEIKNPLFVWWHTLSHAIINSLALSCGYNSTSLNERIYIRDDNVGILIYNTSPGEDSGMGGLVQRAKSFDIVLRNAMDSIINCSNDPLCYNENIDINKVNGAACHNCLLISETSCEHRNSLLDRHMFVK